MTREDIIKLVRQDELLMHDGWGGFKVVSPTGRFTEDNMSPTYPRYSVEVRLGAFAGRQWVPVTLLKEIQEARNAK